MKNKISGLNNALPYVSAFYRVDLPEYKPRERLLCFLLLMLLMSCGESEQDRRDKYQATLPPDNGKQVEVNGEKFRIVYIGGVRFRFPATNQFRWMSGSYPETNGMYIDLVWPPDKINTVSIIVTGTSDPVEIDKSKTIEQKHGLSPDKYIVRDDLKLGLRTFVSKNTPKALIDKGIVHYAYSLTSDAVEPWGGQPIVIAHDFIYFMYAPKVQVRMNIEMTTIVGINPNWKSNYLGIVRILNKYREDKK